MSLQLCIAHNLSRSNTGLSSRARSCCHCFRLKPRFGQSWHNGVAQSSGTFQVGNLGKRKMTNGPSTCQGGTLPAHHACKNGRSDTEWPQFHKLRMLLTVVYTTPGCSGVVELHPLLHHMPPPTLSMDISHAAVRGNVGERWTRRLSPGHVERTRHLLGLRLFSVMEQLLMLNPSYGATLEGEPVRSPSRWCNSVRRLFMKTERPTSAVPKPTNRKDRLRLHNSVP
jgi:hypothetical protein